MSEDEKSRFSVGVIGAGIQGGCISLYLIKWNIQWECNYILHSIQVPNE